MTEHKVLLIGSKGMAGHVLYHYLKEQGVDVEDISRDDKYFPSTWHLDITNVAAVEEVIAAGAYSAIVNCIGILNADAESNPAKAILLNSHFPHALAHAAAKTNSRLIHISTDCVFNGKRGGYVESDVKDGEGFYARTKALGEVEYGPHLTIRTSIIGPELKTDGIGLLNWFLSQAGVIKGYDRAFWTGLTTTELAKAVHTFLFKPELTGLIHLVPKEKISKYDLLTCFLDILGNNRLETIEVNNSYAVDKSLLSTRQDIGYNVPDYRQMLRELKSWMNEHPQLYSRYLDVMKPIIH